MLKLLLIFSISLHLNATVPSSNHESDLSSYELFEQKDTAPKIKTKKIGPNQIGFTIAIEKDKKIMKINVPIFENKELGIVSNGAIQTLKDVCSNTNEIKLKAKFENKFANIHKNGKVHTSEIQLKCGEYKMIILQEKSTLGEVFRIWDIVKRSWYKFANTQLTGFWKKQIKIHWPSNGDYYTGGTVHITKGYQWDVVAHELGHAIYALARVGSSGGGRHKIDECYTKNLALSEGWASFFGAWVMLSTRATDAKFEYLVPRRAPIRIEHIPSDVCKGQTNEWRVTGFLWDLLDHNEDNESIRISFKSLWKVFLNGGHRDTRSIAKKLIEKGNDPVLMNVVWENNFLTQL